MSASQDKKRRQAAKAAGESPKTLAERQAEQKARKERRTWSIVGAIVAVFVVLVIVLNTNLLYTGTTSLTIGDHKYTNAEYQYYYNTAYNNFVYNYNSYLSLFQFDSSADPEDQAFNETSVSVIEMFAPGSVPESLSGDNLSEDATWADYFRAVALENMVQVTAIYDAAVEAGCTLSEEDAAEIDSTMELYESMAESNNLRGADGYVAVVYGKGVTAGLVRTLLERAYIAEDYAEQVYEGFEYSREELDSYYDENADDFDAFTFDSFYIAAERVEVTETVTDEETGEESEETNEKVTDETMAEAEEAANAVAEAVENGESLEDAATEDGEYTEYENVFGYNVSTSFIDPVADWLFDSARADGDVGVVESDGAGWYVLVYHSRTDSSDYNGVAFRHILVKADDADEDGEISAEEKEEAKTAIDEIYDQWVEDGETEDAFAALANSESEDTGSNGSSAYGGEGGLYEHVAHNQMVDEINDWIFDPEREYGDTTIVYVSNSSYSGWHLVYFVGVDDMSYHDCLAEYGMQSYPNAPQGLRAPDYDEWLAGLEAGYPVEINGFVNWFAKV